MRSLVLFLSLFLVACVKDVKRETIVPPKVIVVVMDGARYSETFGDSQSLYTPFLNDTLAAEGVVCTRFYNTGKTFTVAGHTTITTGFHQDINNSGIELPDRHSFLQEWLSETGADVSKAWLITSKDKLEVLADTRENGWSGTWIPSTDCGNDGNGSGYRDDSITLVNAIEVLRTHQPEVLLVNFKEPDATGHGGDWEAYIQAIKETDKYISQIWNEIESSPFYQGKTAFFVTNDHGRHLDSISDGFKSHGDNCEGCSHICLWAAGTGIRQGELDSTEYDLRDLNATITHLLGISKISVEGNPMMTLFE